MDFSNMEFLTIDEISELLKISKPKIYGMCRNGAIKAYKIENEWRVDKKDFEEYLNSCVNRKGE